MGIAGGQHVAPPRAARPERVDQRAEVRGARQPQRLPGAHRRDRAERRECRRRPGICSRLSNSACALVGEAWTTALRGRARERTIRVRSPTRRTTDHEHDDRLDLPALQVPVLSGTNCPTGGKHEPAEVGPVTDAITALLIALDAAVATARRQAEERNHDHQV